MRATTLKMPKEGSFVRAKEWLVRPIMFIEHKFLLFSKKISLISKSSTFQSKNPENVRQLKYDISLKNERVVELMEE